MARGSAQRHGRLRAAGGVSGAALGGARREGVQPFADKRALLLALPRAAARPRTRRRGPAAEGRCCRSARRRRGGAWSGSRRTAGGCAACRGEHFRAPLPPLRGASSLLHISGHMEPTTSARSSRRAARRSDAPASLEDAELFAPVRRHAPRRSRAMRDCARARPSRGSPCARSARACACRRAMFHLTYLT